MPGPQNGRYASEPKSGLTSLTEFDSGKTRYNASAQLATDIGDTVKRIDGTEVPLLTPWTTHGAMHSPAAPGKAKSGPKSAAKPSPKKPAGKKPAARVSKAAAAAPSAKPEGRPAKPSAKTSGAASKPRTMKAPRKAGADDLKFIKGVGPALEKLLHSMGFFHYDQVAKWTDAEIAWVDDNLEGFKGRVSRDNWVEQARLLADGKETEFSKRAKKGGVY